MTKQSYIIICCLVRDGKVVFSDLQEFKDETEVINYIKVLNKSTNYYFYKYKCL